MTAGVLELLPWVAGTAAAAAAVALFQRPLRFLVTLVLRTGAGLLCLRALSHAGARLGASLGVNLLNALTLGALGTPGLGLLLLLKWTFR